MMSCSLFSPDLKDEVLDNLPKFEKLQTSLINSEVIKHLENVENSNMILWAGTIDDLKELKIDSSTIQIAKDLYMSNIISGDTSIIIWDINNIGFVHIDEGRSTTYIQFDSYNHLENAGISDERYTVKLKDKWYINYLYNMDPDFEE